MEGQTGGVNARKTLLLLLAFATFLGRANEARMLINCTSVRVNPASVRSSGQNYELGFTTANDDVNGEWYVSDGNTTYFTDALLRVPGFADPLDFSFNIDLPATGDTDLDFVTDFFEVSRAISGETTTGTLLYDDGVESYTGQVNATWNRPAGATTGTVLLRVNLLRDLGLPILTFSHTFEIYQYQGTLNYAVKGARVEATVDLSRQGRAGRFNGPFPMGRRSHAELEFSATNWTGPDGETYSVLGSTDTAEELLLTRGATGTNYYGSFFFVDGVPSTPFPDEYDLWDVQILDPNDENGNHLPDLTDGTEFIPPAGLVVALKNTGGQLTLTVTAKTGLQIFVERRSVLDAADWVPVETRTLAADSEVVELGALTEIAQFYRARTP